MNEPINRHRLRGHNENSVRVKKKIIIKKYMYKRSGFLLLLYSKLSDNILVAYKIW